jgi:DeoR/GlpR family transcriptional regulator of sugar metabolism
MQEVRGSIPLGSTKIVALSKAQGRVLVEELAAHFAVSPQTIRKDLNELCDRRILTRTHGGALFASGAANLEYEQRRTIAAAEKQAIGAAAARMIPNRASLFINIGTTTEAVADALLDHDGLLVITNNINVANRMRVYPSFEVIIAGGAVRASDGGIVGEAAVDFIEQFKVDFAVIGTSAIDERDQPLQHPHPPQGTVRADRSGERADVCLRPDRLRPRPYRQRPARRGLRRALPAAAPRLRRRAHVTYVRNITDVDDKINARAAETGRPIRDITEETVAWYREDMAALGALRPTHEPRATEFVPQMVAMIEALIAKGHAYAAEGHVLFAVASYPDYGRFARRSLDEMRAGARVEVAPYKRDPMDFVLWKPSRRRAARLGEPLGAGAAGLAHRVLGDEPRAARRLVRHPRRRHRPDVPPPRERDRPVRLRPPRRGLRPGLDAQRLPAGRGREDVQEPGQLLHGARPARPRRAGRGDPLRAPVDALPAAAGLDRRIAHEADRSVGKLAGMLGARGVTSLECLTAGQPIGEVVAALGDDLNTRKALDALQPAAVRESLREEDEDYLARIYASQLLLGFDLRDHPEARVAAERHDVLIGIIQTQSGDLLRAKALAAKLDAARRAKNFPEADRLRKVLMEAGLEVRTGPEGTMVLPLSGFDPGKLEAPS